MTLHLFGIFTELLRKPLALFDQNFTNRYVLQRFRLWHPSGTRDISTSHAIPDLGDALTQQRSRSHLSLPTAVEP
jgi:hypothetical protein